MRILIFSDTHLSNVFEEKKYRFLKHIISSSDRVIINGDFWEGFSVEFSQFIHSSWKELFPLLKKKKTIYIIGNHDKKDWIDQRYSLFASQQTDRYILTPNGKTFIVEHGHRYLPFPTDKIPSKTVRTALNTAADNVEKILLKLVGKKALQRFEKRFNKILKAKFQKEFTKNEILISGHTHSAEFSLKERFVNSGMIKHGLAQYIVFEAGKLKPKEEWYDS